MVRELYNRIGLRGFVLTLAILIILSGIGGIIFERILLPRLYAYPVLRKLKILDTRAPIVINNREEVRISESVNTQEVASRMRDTLLRVYSGDSFMASGFFVTNDGLAAAPNVGLNAGAPYKVLTAAGKFYEAEFAGADPVFGVAYLKTSAENAAVINPGRTFDKASGETLLALSLSEQPGTVLARTVELLAKTSVSEHAAQIDLSHPNFPLLLDESLGPDRLGTVFADRDAQLAGFVSAVDQRPVYLRAEDLRLSIDNFLKNNQAVSWPQFRLSYSIYDPIWAEHAGLPKKYGVLVRQGSGLLSPGDYIFGIDGQDISAEEGFQEMILSHKIGDRVKFKLIRQGKEMEIDVNI